MTRRNEKRVLVAGGAGFIGSHLCDALLAQDCRVVCLDSLVTGREENLRHLAHEPRFDLIRRDVIETLPRRLAVDEIYNLACAASPPHYQADPEHTLLTSVVGTHHLLELAEDCGARFLLTSTSEVYGDPEVHPQPEDYHGNVNPTGPRACYDEGKWAAETLAFDFLRGGRAVVRVARIFNTYGPRMRPDDGRVVSNVICQALSGKPITVYGSGAQTRSFCYVDDMVSGLLNLMACEAPLSQPVNLGNPVELTVSDLVERVVRLTGRSAEIVHKPLPVDDPRRRRPDITRARDLLGWQPQVGLEEGLRQTVAYFAACQSEAARPLQRGRRSEARPPALEPQPALAASAGT